jgi:hypothetical protein
MVMLLGSASGKSLAAYSVTCLWYLTDQRFYTTKVALTFEISKDVKKSKWIERKWIKDD